MQQGTEEISTSGLKMAASWGRVQAGWSVSKEREPCLPPDYAFPNHYSVFDYRSFPLFLRSSHYDWAFHAQEPTNLDDRNNVKEYSSTHCLSKVVSESKKVNRSIYSANQQEKSKNQLSDTEANDNADKDKVIKCDEREAWT